MLVPFETLTDCLYNGRSHWPGEHVQLIIDKVFREKIMVYMALTLSSCTFLLNFWILPVFVVVFIANDLLRCLINDL